MTEREWLELSELAERWQDESTHLIEEGALAQRSIYMRLPEPWSSLAADMVQAGRVDGQGHGLRQAAHELAQFLDRHSPWPEQLTGMEPCLPGDFGGAEPDSGAQQA